MNTLSCFAKLETLKIFAEMNGMNLTEIRHAQVCYLYHVAEMKRSAIAEITGYAVSTLSKLRSTTYGLLDFALEIFNSIIEEQVEELTQVEVAIAELEEEILVEEITECVVEEIVNEIEKTLFRKYEDKEIPMNYLKNCGADTKGEEQVYLIKFFGEDEEKPLFSKIGTTKVSVNSRLRNEIKYYNDHNLDVRSADVCKIVPCGEMPAESYESFLRALLIKKYPNTWHKNDRFFGVDIDTETFVRMCEQFKNL